MHVHSSSLSLAARLHWCHANHSCYINYGWLEFFRQTSYIYIWNYYYIYIHRCIYVCMCVYMIYSCVCIYKYDDRKHYLPSFGMLERATYLGWWIIVILKVAFRAGSSKQGKTFLANVGSIWDANRALKYIFGKNQFIFISNQWKKKILRDYGL